MLVASSMPEQFLPTLIVNSKQGPECLGPTCGCHISTGRQESELITRRVHNARSQVQLKLNHGVA